MNGAAAAAVEPGGAPEDLRHGAAGIGATGQHMAMVAMGGVETVARLQHRHDRGAGRLLPDIEVIVPDKLLLHRHPQHVLLEAADDQHGLEQAPSQLTRQRSEHR